jgi:hypothetical protein
MLENIGNSKKRETRKLGKYFFRMKIYIRINKILKKITAYFPDKIILSERYKKGIMRR